MPLWSHLRRSKRGSFAILLCELAEGLESSLQGQPVLWPQLFQFGKDAVCDCGDAWVLDLMGFCRWLRKTQQDWM